MEEDLNVNVTSTKDGKSIVLWHPYEPQGIGVGLMFEKGGRLQLYRHTGVYTDRKLVTTEQGLRTFQQLQQDLMDYAKKHYPKEFAELK